MVCQVAPFRVIPDVEQLEDRTTPNVQFVNGVITYFGTGGADQIIVDQIGNDLTINGDVFRAASVRQVVIDAADGNDTVRIGSAVTAEVWVFGRGGDDVLIGGGSRAYLYGGTGNDTLQGSSAADVLVGGPGVNAVSGPAGARVVSGSLVQTANLDVVGRTIADLINRERAAAGLPTLEVNGQLVAASQIHSRNMASMVAVYGHAAAMQHVLLGRETPTLGTRADLVGYDYRLLGENLAYGYLTPQAVVQAWMNSSGHRANILNANFTQIGVAVAWSSDGIPYYTLLFGTPASVSSSTNVAPTALSSSAGSVAPATVSAATNPTPLTSTPTPSSTNNSPSIRGWVAVGAERGSAPWVSLIDVVTGAQRQALVYDHTFRGGVRLAVADVTGDGVADVITAPGPGMAPWVKVFDGASGNLLRTFLAYNPRWTGGVLVAAGDVTGDGIADIVTASDAPSAGLVRVFDGRSGSILRTFWAFAGTRWGSQVWVGDVNGDGRADVITAPSSAPTSEIRIFDGRTYALTRVDLRSRNIAALSVGDVDGDRRPELVYSNGTGPVRIMDLNGRDLPPVDLGNVVGLRVAARDLDGDGKAELLTAFSTDQGSRRLFVVTVSGRVLAQLSLPIAGAAVMA